MPCRDDRSYEYDDRIYKEKIDKLTNMLCHTLGRIEDTLSQPDAFMHSLGSEVNEWWNMHKEADRKRRSAEEEEKKKAAAARIAVNKLTDYELQALGLKRDKYL